MRNGFASTTSIITPEQSHVSDIYGLIRNNLMLDAWSQAEGDLKLWAPGEARHVAAKLIAHLGDSRLTHVLRILNARHFPDEFKYANYYLYWKLEYSGPYQALPVIEQWLTSKKELTSEQSAELLAIKARALSYLSDHDQAQSNIENALQLAPDCEWLWSTKASILDKADRYEEALEVAQQAYELNPKSVNSGLQLSKSLLQTSRFEDAEELLLHCHETYQNAAYVSRLQAVYSEREDHKKALWSLNEYVRLSPLIDKGNLSWVAGRKADMCIISNDLEEAEVHLESAKSSFHLHIKENLPSRKGPDYKRKRLHVPFIKQHNMTCAPSTLASIAKYWGDDHDHLKIADAICYEGTPWHKERQWLIENNYHTREFRLTKESLHALIDRGVPFTLTTSWITGSHMQACIGYDQRTGVVIMRDPTFNHYTEILLESLLSDHPVEGPRALLMIPAKKVELLNGVDLADEPLYDSYFHLSAAIESSDEAQIDSIIECMRLDKPKHPLTGKARQDVARYYGDNKTEAEISLERAQQHPEIEKYSYASLYLIQREQGSAKHLEFIKKVVSKAGHDPIFDAELGEAYLENRATWDDAKKHLKLALQKRPLEARSYASYSRYFSLTNQLEEAAKLMRVASIIAAGHEYYAQSYYEISAELGAAHQGIEFLKKRAHSSAEKTPSPLLTLVECYVRENQEVQAKEALELALEKHPDNGELLTQASNYLSNWGEPERGLELLQRAKGKLPMAEWYYQVGRFHNFIGNKKEALEAFEQSCAINPAYTHAINSVASIKSHFDPDAATLFLEEQLKDQPTNSHLLNILITWHAESNPERSCELIEILLKKTPNNTWAWRQKSINLTLMRQHKDAIESAQKAYALQPNSPDSNGILADAYEHVGEYTLADKHYRKALNSNIDYTWAAQKFVALASRHGDNKEALQFLKEQMEQQVTDGSILPTFWEEAHRFIEPEELQEMLEHVISIRPNLWQAHSVLATHLIHVDQTAQAHSVMLNASQKFPLITRTWVDLANARKALGDREGEIEALEMALQLSPSWDWIGRMLAEAYEWLGEIEKSERVLRKTYSWNPSHAPNAGMLADLLWKKGNREEAYSTLSEGLKKDYDYSWGWTTIIEWSSLLGKDYEHLIEHHRKQLSHLSYWWNAESDIWHNNQDTKQALSCIEKAIELSPKNTTYWSQKAFYLTLLQKFEEAEESCNPASIKGESHAELDVRLSWVRWQAGRHSEALSLLEKSIQEHPTYVWAYQEYLSWNAYLEKWDAVAEKASVLSKLTPQNSAVWNRLAQASLELNQQEEAIKALERSHALDPTSDYAANMLLKSYLKANQVDKAQVVLSRIRHFQPESVIALCETRIALCSGDKDKAAQHLAEMVQSPTGDTDDFSEIDDMLKLKGWHKLFAKTLTREVTEGRAQNSASIQAWIYHQHFILKVAKKLQALPYSDELKFDAWNWLIDWAVGLEEKSIPIKLSKKYPVYQNNTYLWGRLLYLTQQKGNWLHAIKWSDDYQKREGVQPWMMVNRTRALIAQNKLPEALETTLFATNQLPPDEHTSMVESQLAYLLAVSGDDQSAEHLISNPHNSDSDWGDHYNLLTQVIIESSNKLKTKPLWKKFREDNSNWKKDPILLNLVRAARKRVRQKKDKWPQFGIFLERGTNPLTRALFLFVYAILAVILIILSVAVLMYFSS